MTQILALRIALLVSAIVIFGVGIRTNDERARWVGLALLAAALLLRFVNRGRGGGAAPGA